MFPISGPANHLQQTRAVRVWASDARCATGLLTFLASTVYRASRVSADTLAVVPPPGLDPGLARRELESYLYLWRRQHPGRGVELYPRT